MEDMQTKIASVKKLIQEKTSHPFLRQHIQSPTIDDDKILFLLSVLEQTGISNGKRDHYALTAMLIQIALDTHERITNAECNELDRQFRQITVLAGDYYSGLYYKLLAETDDILMVRALSEGVRNVNEYKIHLYQLQCNEVDSLMKTIKIIETAIMQKVLDFFNIQDTYETVSEFFLIKRLLEEKKAFIHTGTSIVFEGLKKLTFNKQLSRITNEQIRHLLTICDRCIERSTSMVEKGLKKIPFLNDFLEERIRILLNQDQSNAISLAEEG
ncbi:heptaprenyl diphosphate synthase component 1 [Bacillaceae bacterium Marseille-Q3522]|nr:heptaprenyl diphosphate synthase component 1 [Bacillaceae bacterium Marseille-Q3522]